MNGLRCNAASISIRLRLIIRFFFYAFCSGYHRENNWAINWIVRTMLSINGARYHVGTEPRGTILSGVQKSPDCLVDNLWRGFFYQIVCHFKFRIVFLIIKQNFGKSRQFIHMQPSRYPELL